MIEERDDDRDDRARLAQASPDRHLVGVGTRSGRVAPRRAGAIDRGLRRRRADRERGSPPSGSDGTVSAVRPAIGRWSCPGPSRSSARPPAGRGRCRAAAGCPWRPGSRAGPRRSPGRGRARRSPGPPEARRRRRVAIERGVGHADLEDRVRVGHGDTGQAVLVGELGGRLVAAAEQAGVVDLDPVDERGQGSHLGVAERASRASGRTGAGYRRGHPAPVRRRSSPPPTTRRDGAFQVGADEVAVAGLHLLADDDRQARRAQPRAPQGAVDAVMVGHDEVGQAAGRGGAHHVGRPGQAVEARGRVAVQVDERAGR